MEIESDHPHAPDRSLRAFAWSSLQLQGGERILALCTIAAGLMSMALRLHHDLGAALWIDESWTGALASQPTLAALTEQIRNDANAPVYYYVIWAWAKLFGLSNVALHIPSMIIGIVTPAIAWAGLKRLNPVLALVWAALLATWIPGIEISEYARCYALLMCASVVATITYVRLWHDPTLERATVWALAASLMTLVHYHAGLLALAQGSVWLAHHRGRALRLWPAALVFLPAFAWIAWHAPRLAAFARPDVAWYDRVTVADLPAVASFFLGPARSPLIVAAALMAALVLSRARRSNSRNRTPVEAAALWAGGVALVAAAACVGLGALRPTFSLRYLTPFAPGILLLIAASIVVVSRSRWEPIALLVGGSILSMSLLSATILNESRPVYTFEAASAWLAKAAPSRLVFFWDHPATSVEAPSQLDAVGGFFLRRAGRPVDVEPIYPSHGADMNDPIITATGPDSAVLWLYDTAIHDTTAQRHPPRLALDGPELECRDFGAFNIGVMACRRRTAR